MIDVFKAAANLQEVCDRQGWRCCCIGGIAVQRWGEPRVTRDVDLTLLTGFGGEADFVDALLAAYSGRIHGARDAYFSCRRLTAWESTSHWPRSPLKNS